MISISRQYRFEAAHFLPDVPDGHKCKNMHGHNYRIVVTIIGQGQFGGIDARGFVMDFAELDAIVLPLLSLLDHKVLNDTIRNPTAEHLAFWIAMGVPQVNSVRVYETDDCWAEFTVNPSTNQEKS